MVRPIEPEAPISKAKSVSRVQRTDSAPDKQAEHRVDDRGGESKEKRNKKSDHSLHAETVHLQGLKRDAGEDEGKDPKSPEAPSGDHIDVTG